MAASRCERCTITRRPTPTRWADGSGRDERTAVLLQVSFAEGDLIVNCQTVDEGWMTGMVTRTKQWGMLPANYIERCH